MPPKRAAADGGSRAKKSRPSNEGAGEAGAAPPAIPRSKRWASGVSGSANIEAGYQEQLLQNPVKAFEFVCMCRPPFRNGDDDDEDEDEDDEEDEDDDDEDEENHEPEKDAAQKKGAGKQAKAKCDGGETCLCEKPAAEHPDHVWTLSFAGNRKFFAQYTHQDLRDPDSFGMYTFNDHSAYGVLEMLQNLILDFDEAAGNRKEQWAVCEALAFYLATPMAAVVTQADDSYQIDETFQLIGRLFMSMLARLEREGLLTKDSEVKNLGLIIALFMDFARHSHDYGLLEDSDKESLGPAKDKKKWCPHEFDKHILAYARKYDIGLVGPHNIDKIIEEADGDVDLPVPASNNTAKADPFGFSKTLKSYKKEYAGCLAFMAQTGGNSKTPIGGDNLDITTWTSAQRKKKAFDNKDPLNKEMINALKEGMIVSRG